MQHTETFQAEPDWAEAAEDIGLSVDPHPPALPVRHDGPLAVRPLPARTGVTLQFPVRNGEAVQVLGFNPARRSALVLNIGTVTVWIAFNRNSATINAGFPLAVGASVALEVADELWAVAAADGGQLAVLAQNEDGGA